MAKLRQSEVLIGQGKTVAKTVTSKSRRREPGRSMLTRASLASDSFCQKLAVPWAMAEVSAWITSVCCVAPFCGVMSTVKKHPAREVAMSTGAAGGVGGPAESTTSATRPGGS